MKQVQIKVVAPAKFSADSQVKLGVFYQGDLIGLYLLHIDDDCRTLSYLDLTTYSAQNRIIQGSLRGFAYHAHSMGEQIAADLAQMGYACEDNWIADPVYDNCLHCSGYSEYMGLDGKRCADRNCIRLQIK